MKELARKDTIASCEALQDEFFAGRSLIIAANRLAEDNGINLYLLQNSFSKRGHKLSLNSHRFTHKRRVSGSGIRSSGVKADRLTRSPRKLGNVLPSRVSVSAERGLAYCPANLPTRVTGRCEPCTSTSDICSRIFSLLVITSGRQSSSVSAQSPPQSTNRLPSSAWASCPLRSSWPRPRGRSGT